MKIALFGGSFDPPHRGHLQVGITLLEQKVAEQVWYVPVKQHPFGKQLSADQDRAAMVEAMITSPWAERSGVGDRLIASDHELRKTQPSYSLLTLTELSAAHPDDAFCWVIGSDNIAAFSQWYRYQELLDRFTVYVYPRSQYPMAGLLPGMEPLEAEEVTVSSTQIRQLVADRQPITDLVEPAVEQYIKDHHLYVASSS